MKPVDSFVATLKNNGQSVTTARRAVFYALQGKEPLTMHELVTRCKGADRASVYRTVALFETLGIVQRLQSGWKYKLELSSAFHEHHHHATCLRCGNTIVLPEDTVIEARLRTLTAGIGFRLDRHQLELQGYCPTCQTLQN